MTFEEALTQELDAIPELTGKVYPISATGKKAPYAQYISSFGVQDKEFGGYMVSKSVDAELNIITGSYEELKPLMAAVIGILTSFEGRVIGQNGPYIQELSYDQPVEMYEPNPRLYRSVVSFRAFFEEV